MAINTITYSNKTAINVNADIPDINKVKADDMNEIKQVVNDNATAMGDVSTLKTNTTTDIVAGVNSIIDAEVYSTTEVKTNKVWTDGKPIYKKVISIPSFSNNTINVDTGLTTIEEIVSFAGSYARTGYTRRYSIDNTYMAEWDIDLTTGIIDLATNNQFVTFSGYIILEYTKTTD